MRKMSETCGCVKLNARLLFRERKKNVSDVKP